MTLSALDRERLRWALEIAHEAIGLSDPNPRVGCVIGRRDGTLLASGHTEAVGSAHAEVMALRQARAAGHDLRGATAWVTLEPCAHHGRTPPCCDALIDAGIARVVAAVQDPFPEVAGRGFARLRAAGVEVELADAETAEAARELNIGFFSRQLRGRPWVRLKAAASLDGRTALQDGSSQWITGAQARQDGHEWRRRAGAVLTGVGTVLADDPRLDVRLAATSLQPLRVVVDSRLRLPATARLLAPPGKALIVGAGGSEPGRRAEALARAGAEVLACPGLGGRVDLEALLRELARRGVNEVHVEAGAQLNAALLQAELVDELLLYLAPTLLGPGRAIADLQALSALDAARHFQLMDTAIVGNDLRVRCRTTRKASGNPPVDRLDNLP
jgi:diaminohydroxyphosphoribosylaminopyrimidine deaminase/5-amino-6-(5-phosphoribosylamino)uracil reductase